MRANPLSFPVQAKAQLLLLGPAGVLEAQTSWPVTASVEPAGVAIVCHPHPLHQGSMHNKVVTTLVKTFATKHLATVCFNYRGVGKSDGVYGEMHGEIADLLAVIAWVRQVLPLQPIWLAGFSFGAFITASVANDCSDISQLVSIAPAINHANFAALTQIYCPWLIVHGEHDELVPSTTVLDFAQKSPAPVQLIVMPNTSHFFHGQLVNLQHTLHTALLCA